MLSFTFILAMLIGPPDIFNHTAHSMINSPLNIRYSNVLEATTHNTDINSTWTGIIKPGHKLNQKDWLVWINKSVNRLIDYKIDEKEHWATPAETMQSKQGDCEDYVILKMYLLNHLLFDPEDLYMVVVKGVGSNHSVLAVNMNNSIFILDNKNDDVKLSTEITDYTPIYSINTNGFWTYGYKK